MQVLLTVLFWFVHGERLMLLPTAGLLTKMEKMNLASCSDGLLFTKPRQKAQVLVLTFQIHVQNTEKPL
uniref:Putative secreted protein ovary overexpressed n=1 Tax=Rhipicephalus microplus TaxID=6941 RepID=A0A6M2DFA7_RHIMP